MRGMRKKEKEITDPGEIKDILESAKYVTVAMCDGNEPYLVTLSHGFDRNRDCIYFHCAGEGKKIDILKKNSVVWGQAIDDHGYQVGACDHLYATAQFRGEVAFLSDASEKRSALLNMIGKLDPDPKKVVDEQVTDDSVERVTIGRIDISYYSGKKSKNVVIGLDGP